LILLLASTSTNTVQIFANNHILWNGDCLSNYRLSDAQQRMLVFTRRKLIFATELY